MALKPVNYSVCRNCGTAKLPHGACGKCGYVNASLSLQLNKED